jgi:SAM-dependent methyltransferase
MTRYQTFTRPWGANWLAGKYLLPELGRIGSDTRGVVLDLACGESPFRSLFPKCSAYIRVDFAPSDVEVIQGDMLAIPLPDDSVDTVLLFQAITDVPRPEEALREVRRVLRPGGRVVIYESMSYPEHDLPRDYYRLMPQGLRFLAGEAGLDCASVVYLGGLFTRFASLSNKFIFAKLDRSPGPRILGSAITAASNALFYLLDKLAPTGCTASDYLAVLTAQSSSPHGVLS